MSLYSPPGTHNPHNDLPGLGDSKQWPGNEEVIFGWSIRKTCNELTKKSNLWRSIRKTGNEEVIFGLASTKKGQSLPLHDEETHEGGGLLIELPGS